MTAEATTLSPPDRSGEAAVDPGREALSELPPRIVFFDGVCSFCDGAMKWLRDHDTAQRLFYASLQGETAERFRRALPHDFPTTVDSIVYVDASAGTIRIIQRADAILALCEEIGGPWARARALRTLPDSLLDLAYRVFAASRYRLFGQLDACAVPSAEDQRRLLP